MADQGPELAVEVRELNFPGYGDVLGNGSTLIGWCGRLPAY